MRWTPSRPAPARSGPRNENNSLEIPPKAGRPALLRCIRLLRRRRRLRLIGRVRALADHTFGFLRDLRYVQCQILLLPGAHDCDVCLTGGTESAKDLLSASRVIERGPVDGHHQ